MANWYGNSTIGPKVVCSNPVIVMSPKLLACKFFLTGLHGDQIWRNFATLAKRFKTLAKYFNGLLSIWQTFVPTLEKVLCYLTNFHCYLWPNNYLSIWSQELFPTHFSFFTIHLSLNECSILRLLMAGIQTRVLWCSKRLLCQLPNEQDDFAVILYFRPNLYQVDQTIRLILH